MSDAGRATVRTAVRRPAALSATVAVVAAFAAVDLLAAASTRVALAVEAAAVVVVAAGFVLRWRAFRLAGAAVVAAGVAALLGALAFALAEAGQVSEMAKVLLGMVGVFLLAFALIPVRGRGSRGLVKAGTGAVFLAVLLTGVLRDAPVGTLLVSGAATVLAWDAGEHAISVGAHLGRAANTRRIEATHLAGTAVVGGVAVGAGHAVRAGDLPALSLTELGLLLVALILLAAALHD